MPRSTHPKLTLMPCTSSDIPALTPLYLNAFSDPLSLACFPRSSPATTEWWTNMNATDFSEQPTARFLKVIVEDEPTETSENSKQSNIVAYGKWNIPTTDSSGQLVLGGDDPDDMPSWPPGSNTALANDFFGTLATRRRGIMGDRPHCYLEIVCTLPDWRGHGAAGMILEWGVAKADELGMECYLEAGPGLRKWYASFGFEKVGEFEPEGLKGHVEGFMVRKATKHC